MGKIYFIRHGQASIMKADYDQLSVLGQEQSGILGQYFAAKNFRFDKIYLGTLKRHHQTAAEVETVFKNKKLHWPEPVFTNDFNEHSGPEVVRYVMENSPQVANALQQLKEQNSSTSSIRSYFHLFQKITRQWVRQELQMETVSYESWQNFTTRVHNGINDLRAAAAKGENIAVFSSGGPVAAAVAYALDLSPEKMLELSWLVQNTAVTEFVFSKNRFSLKSFNSVAHLPDEKFITMV